MTDAELQVQYRAAVAGRGAARNAECPSPEQLLALVERTGDEDGRLEILDHAMRCTECHRELALLHAIHAARPRRAAFVPRQWLVAATLLIAVVGGAVISRRVSKQSSDELTRGSANVVTGAAVVVVAPLGPVGAEGLHSLTWRTTPGAVRYVVEVLDSADRVVYSAQTPDTSVVVPPLTASPAAWWVRATLGDGSDRRSPMIGLTENTRR